MNPAASIAVSNDAKVCLNHVYFVWQVIFLSVSLYLYAGSAYSPLSHLYCFIIFFLVVQHDYLIACLFLFHHHYLPSHTLSPTLFTPQKLLSLHELVIYLIMQPIYAYALAVYHGEYNITMFILIIIEYCKEIMILLYARIIIDY